MKRLNSYLILSFLTLSLSCHPVIKTVTIRITPKAITSTTVDNAKVKTAQRSKDSLQHSGDDSTIVTTTVDVMTPAELTVKSIKQDAIIANLVDRIIQLDTVRNYVDSNGVLRMKEYQEFDVIRARKAMIVGDMPLQDVLDSINNNHLPRDTTVNNGPDSTIYQNKIKR